MFWICSNWVCVVSAKQWCNCRKSPAAAANIATRKIQVNNLQPVWQMIYFYQKTFISWQLSLLCCWFQVIYPFFLIIRMLWILTIRQRWEKEKEIIKQCQSIRVTKLIVDAKPGRHRKPWIFLEMLSTHPIKNQNSLKMNESNFRAGIPVYLTHSLLVEKKLLRKTFASMNACRTSGSSTSLGCPIRVIFVYRLKIPQFGQPTFAFYDAWKNFFKRCPGRGANLGSFWYFVYFLSQAAP